MAANGLAALGERERAREWARARRALRPDDGMVLYNVACVFSPARAGGAGAPTA